MVGPAHGLTKLVSYSMEKGTLSAGCAELLQHTVYFCEKGALMFAMIPTRNVELDLYLAFIRLNVRMQSFILDYMFNNIRYESSHSPVNIACRKC